MRTFADPTRCPDCGALLPQDPQVCQQCALPLTGATAADLYSTLQQADRLLAARADLTDDVALLAVQLL